MLVFEADEGRARVFPPGTRPPPGSLALEWSDTDAEARKFNRRRLEGEEVPDQEHDALVARRKAKRAREGIELFDDWLLRAAHAAPACRARVELVLEAPVPADEVELHVEPGVGPAPAAHECLRRLETDSDEDSDGAADPDDGCGLFLSYLRRRVGGRLPGGGRVRCVDPRSLGAGDDAEAARAFQALLVEPRPRDAEAEELDALGAEWAGKPGPEELEEPGDGESEEEDWGPPLPSWEAYFGAAGELLYYSGHVKADYAPLLAGCVGGEEAMRRFFEELYFGTVPAALAELRLSPETRPLAWLRPPSLRPEGGGALLRRPDDEGLLPVKAAPLDRYLKAKGTDPPRTWVSGLALRLEHAGAGGVVNAARAWYGRAVGRMLDDPKGADLEGDYFLAWLRECHPDVYADVDRAAPNELRDLAWAPSLSQPRCRERRHALGGIRIPDAAAAFAEFSLLDPAARTTTRRERVLAKILVDIFQLRLVDVAAALAVADAVVGAPPGGRVVVVLYAGGDHARCVADFWREQGLTSRGLPRGGFVGSEEGFADGESHALRLPGYLRDPAGLFPVPAGDG